MKKFKIKKQYKNILVSVLGVLVLIIGAIALINSQSTKAESLEKCQNSCNSLSGNDKNKCMESCNSSSKTSSSTSASKYTTTSAASAICSSGYQKEGGIPYTARNLCDNSKYALFCEDEGLKNTDGVVYACSQNFDNNTYFGRGLIAIYNKAKELYGDNSQLQSHYKAIDDAVKVWKHYNGMSVNCQITNGADGPCATLNKQYQSAAVLLHSGSADQITSITSANTEVENSKKMLNAALNAENINTTEKSITIDKDLEDEFDSKNDRYTATLHYIIQGLDSFTNGESFVTFDNLEYEKSDSFSCSANIADGTKIIEKGNKSQTFAQEVIVTCKGTYSDMLQHLSSSASDSDTVKFNISWYDPSASNVTIFEANANKNCVSSKSYQTYLAISINDNADNMKTSQQIVLDELEIVKCEFKNDKYYINGVETDVVTVTETKEPDCCYLVEDQYDKLSESEKEAYDKNCDTKKDTCDDLTPGTDEWNKNDCCSTLSPDSDEYKNAGCGIDCSAKVEYPDNNVCDASKPDAERTTYIKESNNFNTCIIDKKDESGNSYNVSTDIVSDDNPYCAVSCKEDYDFFLPTSRFDVKQGTYFFLSTIITGTRTCVVGNSNNNTTTAAIDKKQFDDDVAALNKEIANANANYLTAKSIEDASPEKGRTDNCSTAPNYSHNDKYTVHYTLYKVKENDYKNVSSSKASKTDGSCHDGDGSASGAKEKALDTLVDRNNKTHGSSNEWKKYYDDLVSELETKYIQYNQCTNWTDKVDYEFDPKIDYTYDQETYMDLVWKSYKKASFEKAQVKTTANGAWEIVSKIEDGKDEETIKADTIDTAIEYGSSADGANGYIVSNASSTDTKTTVDIITECDTTGCNIEKKEISASLSVKKTQTASALYKPAATFYALSPNGAAVITKDSDKTYTEIGRVFPVALTTPLGTDHNYKLGFYDIGMYQDSSTGNAHLGRIVNITAEPSGFKMDTFGQYSLYGNVKDQFIHSCGYEVTKDVCDKCETYSCATINGVRPADCEAAYNNIDYSFSFRSVSNGNLFPNSTTSYIETKNGTDKLVGYIDSTDISKTANTNDQKITQATGDNLFGTENGNSYSTSGNYDSEVGANWSSEKGTDTKNAIQTAGDSIYELPEYLDYSFTLSPSQMKNLRKINNEFYYSFNNSLIEGTNDSSQMGSGDNVYSVYQSEMLRNANYNNGEYFTWNECKYKDADKSMFEPWTGTIIKGQGPAWK